MNQLASTACVHGKGGACVETEHMAHRRILSTCFYTRGTEKFRNWSGEEVQSTVRDLWRQQAGFLDRREHMYACTIAVLLYAVKHSRAKTNVVFM